MSTLVDAEQPAPDEVIEPSAGEPTDLASDAVGRGRAARARERVGRVTNESWIGAAIVGACVLFVGAQLHPDLLVANTTPAGGDMGAHVWGPAFLRDHLLPHGRVIGWTKDWYAGFPAFQFYMLPPALLIVALNTVLPYGVAFKLVTVSGILAMPVCAYAMGRLLRLPFPGPPLLAVATMPFLFDRNWTIYGGNIPSTLAGEYSFTISLSLALLFFGVLARSLETGKYRGTATVLLALTILCHAIPSFFALAGGMVLVLMQRDRHRLTFAAPVLVLGCLLTGFWSIPFVLRRGLLTDMGWEKLENYSNWLLPQDTRWVAVLALVGLVLSLAFAIRAGIFLACMAVVFGLGFVFDAAAAVHIWNARLLPFMYLALYLLAAIGVSEVLRSIAVILDSKEATRQRLIEVSGTIFTAAAAVVLVGLPMRSLPGGSLKPDGTYSWMGLSTKDDSFIDSWAAWNYSGYERKVTYPEYRGIVTTMGQVGKEHGCGRAHWEYESDLNRYGTPMALMLLPFWTDGCIGSMEGLYFESSGTTPFHFLDAAELSTAPSNPVRDQPDRPMPYSGFDLENGIRHLQLMGAKYYMAFSDQAVRAADQNPDLTLVAESAPWKVYEVADAEIVAPLTNQPAVVKGLSDKNPAWQKEAVAWYTNPAALDVVLADRGPKDWQRIAEGEEPARRPVPDTTVSHIVEEDLKISFDVDRVGAPILVKTSYFPNWKAKGADGPYHVTPNLMVVVPTSKHVELRYGNTPVEYLGWGSTLAGVLLLLAMVRRGPRVFPEPLADSGVEQGGAELAETDEGAGDPPEDGGPGGPPLLDADGDLGDDEAGPLGP